MSEEPEDFIGRIIFMSMFKDISWGSKDNEQECEISSKLVSIYARRFSHKRSGILLMKANHKERQSRRTDDVKIRPKQTTQSSDPQVHCPEEYSKAKAVEN